MAEQSSNTIATRLRDMQRLREQRLATPIPKGITSATVYGNGVELEPMPNETPTAVFDLLPVHPATELFPLLNDEDLAKLADDIREHGLIEPIWMWDDPDKGRVLLDGRNRYKACKLAGVEVQERVYTGDNPTSFSLSQNLKRRHLTVGQRAMAALAAEPLFAADAERRRNKSLVPGARFLVEANLPQPENEIEKPVERLSQTRDLVAEIAGVSPRVITQAKTVAAAAPELAAKVKSGEMSLGGAEQAVRERRNGFVSRSVVNVAELADFRPKSIPTMPIISVPSISTDEVTRLKAALRKHHIGWQSKVSDPTCGTCGEPW